VIRFKNLPVRHTILLEDSIGVSIRSDLVDLYRQHNPHERLAPPILPVSYFREKTQNARICSLMLGFGATSPEASMIWSSGLAWEVQQTHS
jgi:hypothetical protein